MRQSQLKGTATIKYPFPKKEINSPPKIGLYSKNY